MEKLPTVRYIRPTLFEAPQRPQIDRPTITDCKRELDTVKIEFTDIMVHPIAHLAGVFEDEPLWDEFLQAIKEYRKEVEEVE